MALSADYVSAILTNVPPSSRGLGHRPFKPVTAIRIRLGAPIIVSGFGTFFILLSDSSFRGALGEIKPLGEEGGAIMAGESLMGIAKDLTVPVLRQLSTSGSVEGYGKRIGRLYRIVLKEVELGRIEVLTNRGVESRFLGSESGEMGQEE